VRSCKLAVLIELSLTRTTTPSATEKDAILGYRLTINTGTAVVKFHDKRDILSSLGERIKSEQPMCRAWSLSLLR
jgi:hypothetical protein